MDRVRRFIRTLANPPPPFVQPDILESEHENERKCVEVILQPPGRDGLKDYRTLLSLKDTGSDFNIMHLATYNRIYGVDNFRFYGKSRPLYGPGGHIAFQSLGRAHIYLSFKGKEEVYTAEVEVVEDAADNFDLLLGEKFLRIHKLLKWSEKISGKVNYITKSKRLSDPVPMHWTDVEENSMTDNGRLTIND